jgi:hypothetical protein
MGMVWAEIFVGSFLVLFPCGVGFCWTFSLHFGFYLGNWLEVGRSGLSDENDGAAEGSAGHVFFPVHKIGFCLPQPGDV